MIENIEKTERRAVLAGVQTGDGVSFTRSMEELWALAEACGYVPSARVTQRLSHPEAATYVGTGKLEEIRQELYLTEAETVIFLNTLTPSQLSNLARELEAEVLDKTGLILQIFGERARTAEARMQVEYARLEYTLPRLAGLRKNLSRQGGTGGSMSNKGAGETQLELDRRYIEKRMAELRRRLAAVESGRETMRKRRREARLPLVSLVGYTNAGKSTLLNRLLDTCGSEEKKKVLAKDQLFATLDTTVRRITTEGNRDFLLADTVGFLHDLPHDLIKAFRSTFEEARLSDLLLEVVDCSEEGYERQMEVTEKTLRELSAGAIPRICVMNKADKSEYAGRLPHISGNRIYLSAKEGTGIPELLDMIEKKLFGNLLECAFLIPYGEGRAEHLLRSRAEVLETSYREAGVYLKCRLDRRLLSEVKQYALL